jgi:hypothetical protein
MNRVRLLTTSMMTPAELAKGRFMRAPDHPLSDDSASTGDNKGGNAGDSENDDTTGDNASQANELDAFWEDKPAEKPEGESEDDTAAASQALGAELGGLIKSFKAPEVFTKEIADKIAEGDLGGVNEAMAARDTALMQHQMVVTAKLLGGVIDRLSADFEGRIQRALGNRDSEVTLETHFPLAKDPQMRPMVQRVWDQALKNSKGDKEKAIRLTKGMLSAFGEKTSLRDAPADPTAGVNSRAAQSLVASLLERDG